jgi:hypothetical protein
VDSTENSEEPGKLMQAIKMQLLASVVAQGHPSHPYGSAPSLIGRV